MLDRRTVVRTSLVGGLVAATAGLAVIAGQRRVAGPPDVAGWRLIAWPFARDAWPPGRAWRREDVDVYVRPKLGLCGNCDTGVVTDEEVDRVTDIDLLDPRFAPVRDGASFSMGRFPGRARFYRYEPASSTPRQAEGIAVAQKCDLIVAVVAGDVADEHKRSSAHLFLESATVQAWLDQQLEGRS